MAMGDAGGSENMCLSADAGAERDGADMGTARAWGWFGVAEYAALFAPYDFLRGCIERGTDGVRWFQGIGARCGGVGCRLSAVGHVGL